MLTSKYPTKIKSFFIYTRCQWNYYQIYH